MSKQKSQKIIFAAVGAVVFVLCVLYYAIITGVSAQSGSIHALAALAVSPLLLVAVCAAAGFFISPFFRAKSRFFTAFPIAAGLALFLACLLLYAAATGSVGILFDLYALIIYIFYFLIIFLVTPFFSGLARRINDSRDAKKSAGKSSGKN